MDMREGDRWHRRRYRESERQEKPHACERNGEEEKTDKDARMDGRRMHVFVRSHGREKKPLHLPTAPFPPNDTLPPYEHGHVFHLCTCERMVLIFRPMQLPIARNHWNGAIDHVQEPNIAPCRKPSDPIRCLCAPTPVGHAPHGTTKIWESQAFAFATSRDTARSQGSSAPAKARNARGFNEYVRRSLHPIATSARPALPSSCCEGGPSTTRTMETFVESLGCVACE